MGVMSPCHMCWLGIPGILIMRTEWDEALLWVTGSPIGEKGYHAVQCVDGGASGQDSPIELIELHFHLWQPATSPGIDDAHCHGRQHDSASSYDNWVAEEGHQCYAGQSNALIRSPASPVLNSEAARGLGEHTSAL